MNNNRTKKKVNSASDLSKSILGVFSGKSCDSNVMNANEMHLSEKLFDNIIASDEYKKGIERGHYIGFLGHPEDPGCQEFQNACIVMTDMRLDDDGIINADFNLVNTPVGQIVKAFIDAGVQFGISIRGAGDVDGNGEVDPDTFIFRGFDLVAFPAYEDCIPVFQEIAASSDLEKQKKYKKICATVKKNIKEIHSAESLSLIKDQLTEDSEPYTEVYERLQEVCCSPEETTYCEEHSCDEDFKDHQIAALTEAYTDELNELSNVLCKLDELTRCCNQSQENYMCASKKIESMKRIHGQQIAALDTIIVSSDNKTKDVTDKYIKTSKQLNSIEEELKRIKKVNLNYHQKILSSENILKQKNKEIENLNSKLRETVTASKELKVRSSNYDVKLTSLNQKVQAAEEMIFNYQHAYADVYANALGKSISNLYVTSSTKPQELRTMILGGTSTANIPAKPDYSDPEGIEYFGEEVEVAEDDTNPNGIISL